MESMQYKTAAVRSESPEMIGTAISERRPSSAALSELGYAVTSCAICSSLRSCSRSWLPSTTTNGMLRRATGRGSRAMPWRPDAGYHIARKYDHVGRLGIDRPLQPIDRLGHFVRLVRPDMGIGKLYDLEFSVVAELGLSCRCAARDREKCDCQQRSQMQ